MHLSQRTAFVSLNVCVFLSGAAGLAYEIVFARYLGLLLGHDGYAVLAVLVAFMGGLALGNAWIGGKVDRNPDRVLRFYAALEIGIGMYALCFPAVYVVGTQLFVRLAGSWQPVAAGLLALKLGFALSTILLPAVLMGGTLPVVVRFTTQSLDELRERVATFYFINSLGAVFGCLAADFWWIPAFGLPTTLYTGAALNLIACAGALFLNRTSPTQKGTSTHSPAPSSGEERVAAARVKWIAIAVAFSGFAAMLYEVVWTRLVALTLGSTTHAFSLMLASFIAGIAAGAWAIARWNSLRQDLAALARIEVALGALVFVSLALYSYLPYAFVRCASWFAPNPSVYPLYACLQGIVCASVMFVPALLLGATLPLASRAAAWHTARTGDTIGRVLAFNTLAAIFMHTTATRSPQPS